MTISLNSTIEKGHNAYHPGHCHRKYQTLSTRAGRRTSRRQKYRQRLRTEAGRELSYVDRNGGICLMKCGEDGGLIPVA